MECQTIGERIKEVRASKGVTQAEFASKLFVTPSYISKVESDKEVPTNMFLKLVSYEYKVSYKWLTTGEEEIWQQSLSTLLGIFPDDIGIDDIEEIKDTFSAFRTSFLSLNPEDVSSVSILIDELTHILRAANSNVNKKELIQIISEFTRSYSYFVDAFYSTDFSDQKEIKRLINFLDNQKALDIPVLLKELIRSNNPENN